MTDFTDDPERYHVEGDHRSGEADALFGGIGDESTRPAGGTDAGLIAGDREDPVLVAGVGYPLLGDMALGTVVAYRAAGWDLPGVAVADCSHTPVAAYQTITAGDYHALLVVGAEKRGGEINDGSPSADPGTVHEYGPDAVDVPGDTERITRIVGQTAMGLNTLENVLRVTKALGEFPDRTRVLAVEPAYDSWGTNVREFTDPVDRALAVVTDRTLAYLEETLADLDVDDDPAAGAGARAEEVGDAPPADDGGGSTDS
jgi:Ni,Fe-hydrogenase maturation factor